MTTAAYSIAGTFTEADLTRVVGASKSGLIGPTTLYYAGVCAPIISAAMALMTRTALNDIGYPTYYSTLLSAMVAAFAGLSWYLIFVRWSSRQSVGRGAELTAPTDITVDESGLILRRNGVEIRAPWRAIRFDQTKEQDPILRIDGAAPVITPAGWFASESERDAFTTYCRSRAKG